LTLVLDVSPDVAAERRQAPPDRLERRGLEYFRRVRSGFLAEAVRDLASIAVVDAGQDPDAVFAQILKAVRRVMGEEKSE
jgi:dTMP kinase